MRGIAKGLSLVLLLTTISVAQNATFQRKVIPVDANSFGRVEALGDLNKKIVPDLISVIGQTFPDTSRGAFRF